MTTNLYPAWQRVLAVCNGLNGIETAKRTDITWSHISKTLHELERGGFIKMVRHENKRALINELTPKGAKARDAVRVLFGLT